MKLRVVIYSLGHGKGLRCTSGGKKSGFTPSTVTLCLLLGSRSKDLFEHSNKRGRKKSGFTPSKVTLCFPLGIRSKDLFEPSPRSTTHEGEKKIQKKTAHMRVVSLL
jgi:hypothetical protein